MDIRDAGSTVVGWYFAGRPGAGSVLLLHGVRSGKHSQQHKIEMFRKAGYAVLAIDLQAHGESSGDHITFGIKESASVVSAVGWLRQRRPDEQIAVVGQSLGAAAALIGATRTRVDALVLEAPFGDLTTALANRIAIRTGDWSRPVAPILMWAGERITGIASRDLILHERVKELRTPVMIMVGSDDRLATEAEARRIYSAASEPKSFWLVPNAAHVDLAVAAGDAYRAHVITFISSAFQRG